MYVEVCFYNSVTFHRINGILPSKKTVHIITLSFIKNWKEIILVIFAI